MHAAKQSVDRKASGESPSTAAYIKKQTMDEIRQLADKALQVIPERFRHYTLLIGVTYGRITIRNQNGAVAAAKAI